MMWWKPSPGVCVCVRVYVLCVSVCVYVYVYMYVCGWVYMYVCVCVCRRDSNFATSETLQGVVQGVIQNNTSPATYKFHLRGSLLAITPRYSNIHTSLACYLHTLSYTIIGLYTELWKILGWIIDLLHPSCVSCTTIFLTCFQQHKSNTWRKTKGLTSCDMVQGGEGRPNDVL